MSEVHHGHLSSRGRLEIPRDLRRQLGWDGGTELEIVLAGGSVLIRARRPAADGHRLEDLRGCVPYDGPPLTDEDLYAPVSLDPEPGAP